MKDTVHFSYVQCHTNFHQTDLRKSSTKFEICGWFSIWHHKGNRTNEFSIEQLKCMLIDSSGINVNSCAQRPETFSSFTVLYAHLHMHCQNHDETIALVHLFYSVPTHTHTKFAKKKSLLRSHLSAMTAHATLWKNYSWVSHTFDGAVDVQAVACNVQWCNKQLQNKCRQEKSIQNTMFSYE